MKALTIFLLISSCAILKPPDDQINWYVISGNLEALEKSLSDGASPNGDEDDTATPLMVAAWMGSLDAIDLLVKYGANVNQKTKFNGDAALSAVGNNQIESIRLLAKHGVDFDTIYFDEFNLLTIAGKNENKEIEDFLKSKGLVEIFPLENLEKRSSNLMLYICLSYTTGMKIDYDSYLRNKPGFDGQITIKIEVEPNGTANQVTKLASDTDYDEFDDVILEFARTWRFAKIEGEGNDIVTIPFTFKE